MIDELSGEVICTMSDLVSVKMACVVSGMC